MVFARFHCFFFKPENGATRTTSASPTSLSTSPSFPSSTSSSRLSNYSSNSLANFSQPPSGPMYKNVVPHINENSKHRNIVNSALSKQREPSPARPWRSHSAQRCESPPVHPNEDQSRILKYISQEAADAAAESLNGQSSDTTDSQKLYGGSKIPSRMFKHLQSEYSNSSDTTGSMSSTTYDSSVSKPDAGDKPKLSAGLLRLLQSDYNKLYGDQLHADTDNHSVISSTYGEMEEYYKNGLANTAAAKESVLNELTTQFDPVTQQRRKPKAAPGRVFRYLQQQYDSPDEEESNPRSTPRLNSHRNSFDRNSNRNDENSPRVMQSPTLMYLQSQCSSDSSSGYQAKPTSYTNGNRKLSNGDLHDISNLNIREEGDPVVNKSYVGNRIPGRTFRMLQENYASHPSVFQARK